MLELYHWEPNGASARVLISLEEKQLPYTSRYVDVLAFEQLRAEFLALSETGELPVLVREGAVFTEASLICEYLEEAFPGIELMPRDPRGRWQVRVWQKLVDEGFAASVSELAWHAHGARALAAYGADELAARIERIPSKERRDVWKTAAAGIGAEQLARARSRIESAVARIETDLAPGGWLAGSSYSLADIAVFSYFNYLPALCADLVSTGRTPHAVAWLRAVASRPAVRAALARGRARDPFALAAPGPEQIRWG